ncbi:hypothetical protein EC973_004301 [Apophysomyces ossiformis]|uniref:Uncharacterized protein n=1 Tax=Apophysomyces ossiformis TaxID=679940 RepID=A0A8H7BKD4_9FUNG|nr:hypothetical protein EC973_004301 [Apophysomyces ossiformis]
MAMQPHRYFNELSHWRNASQRPQPQLKKNTSPERESTTMPANRHSHTAFSPNDEEHHPDSTKQTLFPVDSNRGWLETTSVKVAPSLSSTYDRSHPSGRKSEKEINAESRKAQDMLGAVSNEDIMKLTQMTQQPIEMPRKHAHKDQRHHRSTDDNSKNGKKQTLHSRHTSVHQLTDGNQDPSTSSKPVKSTDAIDYNKKDSQDPYLNDVPIEHINRNTAEHSPNVSRADPLSRVSGSSISTEDLIFKSQRASVSPHTRPSMSTPPPSTLSSPGNKDISYFTPQEVSRENAKSDNRRSWYKALIKRDKSKGKARADGEINRPTEGSRLSTESDRSQPCTPTELESLPMVRETSCGSTASNKGSTQENSTRQRLPMPSTDILKRMSSLHPTSSMKSRLPWTTSRHQRTSSSALPTTTVDPSLFLTNSQQKKRYDERRHSFDSMQSVIKDYTKSSVKPNGNAAKLRHRISTGGIIKRSNSQNDRKYHFAMIQDKEKNKLLDSSVNYSAWAADEHESPSQAHLGNNTDASDALDGYISDTDGIYRSESECAIKSTCASVSGSESGKAEANEHTDTMRTLLLDYDSLPDDVILLLKKYEDSGKMELNYRKVKRMQKDEYVDSDNDGSDNKDDDGEEEDGEDDDEDDEGDNEEAVNAAKIISSEYFPMKRDAGIKPVIKRIARVHASQDDTYEFVKLGQIADNESFGTGFKSYEQEEMETFSKTVDERLETLQKVSQKAKQFLNDHCDVMDSLGLDDIETQCNLYGSRHSMKGYKSALVKGGSECRPHVSFAVAPSSSSSNSSCNSSQSINPPLSGSAHEPMITSSRYNYASIRRAPSLLLNNIPYRSVNPFDYRQEEVRLGVEALRNEMLEFKRALCSTEELVRDVQIDVNDTRNRMEVYIKDIPESQYSALKKLEVDIEAILANRAKNPWMDTGYALLSYLLTGVWIIICVLKWGRKVILFPHKLWCTYSEYINERNKAVKRASIRSVVGPSDRPREE